MYATQSIQFRDPIYPSPLPPPPPACPRPAPDLPPACPWPFPKGAPNPITPVHVIRKFLTACNLIIAWRCACWCGLAADGSAGRRGGGGGRRGGGHICTACTRRQGLSPYSICFVCRTEVAAPNSVAKSGRVLWARPPLTLLFLFLSLIYAVVVGVLF